MKQLIRHTCTIAVVAAGLALNAQAGSSPGEVDFGKFTPPGNGSEFVEVQIKSNLISIAAKLVEKEEPDVAKIIRSVELIRVNVIGLTDENRDEMKTRVEKIRSELDSKGWERNVNVQGKKNEDVGIFTKTRGEEALAGLVITVMDPKNAVLVNIVGDINPSEVAALAETLDIKPLKDVAKEIKK